MAIEDKLQMAVTQCLSLLRRYHDGERTAEARAKMVAEVEVVIGYLMELKLPPGSTVRGILSPVENHLIDLYGHEAGRGLNKDFVEVFEGPGMPLVFKPKYYQELIDSYA